MEERTLDLSAVNERLEKEISVRLLAEAELRNERNFISAILDSSSALMAVFDPHGRVVRFNRACEDLTGYAFEEVEGQLLWDIFLIPEEVESVKTVINDIVTGQFPNTHENYWLAKNGDRHLIAWSNSAMVDPDGSVRYIVSTGIDITERKRAEDALRTSEEKYRELVENANSIILRMDTEGNITFFNEFAERFFGFEEEDLLGKSVVGTIVPQTDTSGQDLAEMIKNIGLHPERYASNENENTRSNGERVWIAWTNRAIQDEKGRVSEILCVGNDHTDRRRAEEALTKARDQLSTLLEAAQAATSSLELNEVLRLMARSLVTGIGVRNIGIYLLDDRKGKLFPINVRMDTSTPISPIDRAFLSSPLDPDRDAFTREVLELKKPLAVYDCVADPRTDKEIVEILGLRSLLAVPFVVKGRAVAIAMISTFQDYYHFNDEQIELAQGIASAAAVAIENAGLYAETRRRADEIQTLFAVQQAITRRLDPDAVLQMVADEARRLTSAEGTAVFLIEGNEVVISVLSGEQVPGVFGFRTSIDHSLTGVSIRTGKPFLIEDVETEHRIDVGIVKLTGLKSLILVPLLSNTGSLGAIGVASRTPGAFGPEDEWALTMLASAAVVGLENARLYKEEQKRHHEAEQRRLVAETLRDILAVINSNRPLAGVLEHIIDKASELLGADAGAIYRLQDEGKALSIQSARGLPESISERVTVSIGDGFLREALMGRQPGCISDIQSLLANDLGDMEPLREFLSMVASSFCATLAIPLIVRDEVYGGILLYYRDKKECTADELGIAVSFASQTALAIENARLRAQAEENAAAAERSRLARDLHDAVTQTLFSASLIAEVLPRIWSRDEEEGKRRLEELRQLTRGALAEMRTLLLELRPAALLEAPFGDLLRQLAEAATGRSRLPISIRTEGQAELPADVQIALYRIVQEGLNNVCKHSGAIEASLNLQYKTELLELQIIDNGQGFDPGSIPPEHLGLGIMRERAEAIGAIFEVASQPGKGTVITVAWEYEKRRSIDDRS